MISQGGLWAHFEAKQVSQFKQIKFYYHRYFQNTPISAVSYLDDCRIKLTITMSFVRWKPSSYFAQTIIIVVVVVYQSLVIDSRAVGDNICGLFSIGHWAGAVMRYRRDKAVSGCVRPEKVSVGFHSEQLQCKRHLAISAKKSILIIGVYWEKWQVSKVLDGRSLKIV